MKAARNGHTAIVQLLLQCGAVASWVNKLGNSPMHYAALNQHCDILRLLLAAAGRDLLRKNKAGKTPKDLADNELRTWLESEIHLKPRNRSDECPIGEE